MIERKAAAAAMMIAVWAGPCRADECEDFVAKLGAEIPKLEASERAPADRSIVVKLKHPDAAELSLTCFNADAAQPPEFNAKWNSAWPPASFYDLVASVGAIIVSNSEPAVRSGAVLCAQRALTADHNSDVFDVNGATSNARQRTASRRRPAFAFRNSRTSRPRRNHNSFRSQNATGAHIDG